jgi:hypothetical protein
LDIGLRTERVRHHPEVIRDNKPGLQGTWRFNSVAEAAKIVLRHGLATLKYVVFVVHDLTHQPVDKIARFGRELGAAVDMS